MKPLRIGIIGCGAAAQRYYVPAFKKYPELVASLCLVDKNLEQGRALAAQFGGGEVFSDHHDILARVDGVIIALPHFLHFSVAQDFLEAGVYVLCEKPLAETSEQVARMVESAEKKGAILCVNNTRRMFPAFRAVKEIIDSGRIGKLKSIRYTEGNSFAWPSATGFYVDPSVTSKGVLLDLGPHVLDTICWWLGGRPEVLSCQDDSFGGPESVIRIAARLKDCNVDVLLNRLLELDNSYTVVGESGVVEGKIFDWCNCTLKLNSGQVENIYTKTDAKTYPEFVAPIIHNFIRAIKGEEKPLVPAGEVQSSIKMIEDAYEQRKTIQLPWYDKPELPELPAEGKILVTGATGFVGCRIVELLHLSGKCKVRAGIRQWASAARLGRFPVDIVVMDLMKRDDIDKALDGVTHIIHCAKGPGGATDQGTRNLLEISLEKGIKRFVHLSTTEVYGEVNGLIGEDTPFQYTGNEYNKTKIDAEKACWEFAKRGLPVVILRPSIIYGIFSKNWTVHFAQMFREGVWGVYEKYGEGKCNLIYVDDLVQVALLALVNDKAVGQAFNVVGPEVVTWNEYFRLFNDRLGLPPLTTIPASQAGMKTMAMAPVRMAGKIVKKYFMGPVKKLAATFGWADSLLRSAERTLKNTPCSDELSLFSKDAMYSTGKVGDMLQFKPGTGVHKGIGLACDWLSSQGCRSK